MKALASLREAAYEVDGQRLLAPVSMALGPGSRMALLGPNGAGKSTLLRLLSGYLRPSSGAALFAGQPVHAMPLAERSRRIAVLTQRQQLDFPFTVRQVVAMGRLPCRASARQDAEVIDELLELFALPPARDYTSLSGGEQQLAQLARVVAQVWEQGERGLLLLDEPTAPLDLQHQQRLAGLLDRLRAQGLAQLLVLHDVNLALALADRVLLLADGQPVAEGAAAEVINEANLSATYGLAMRLLQDEVSGRQFVLPAP